MKYSFYLFIILLFVQCSGTVQESSDWHLVFINDKAGNTLYGKKTELINLARNGYPIRVGFGGRSKSDTGRSVEHIADCQFLTVRNSKELFAQITPIFGQSPNAEGTEIKFRENYQWSIIVGTNGFSDRINIYLPSDSVAGHNSRPIRVSWFVKSPIPENYKEEERPLWEE